MLDYPDFTQHFEVYTDASSRQLCAVIVQGGRPIVFFIRKQSDAQRKYSVTKLELLSIVECLKKFKSMLWGQKIKVVTDHTNLTQDALGLTSDRVYRWRLLLEEYGPEIIYTKGVDNTVADALSRLEYDPTKNVKDLSTHTSYCHMATILSHYMQGTYGGKDTWAPFLVVLVPDPAEPCSVNAILAVEDCMLQIFTNVEGSEEEIYLPTINEIAQEQRLDRKLGKFFRPNTKVKNKERFFP